MADTTPQTSLPSTVGNTSRWPPKSRIFQSAGLAAMAWLRIRISFSSGFGMGKVRGLRAEPGFSRTAARFSVDILISGLVQCVR